MGDLAGQIIKSYELKKLIGEGGFGAVYLAHQQYIGREVAIKIILPQYANKPDFIRRFETEAQLVARLEHPHIVPLYDYWREPSGAYLVMRWLKGGSIHDILESDGAFTPRRTSQILNQVCEALAVAHRQNVIHRDLKPENIMLDENGNAYLSDFGIAKDVTAQTNITDHNAIIGSPAYLSPEQIKGETLTPQSDIYALGIVLFEMLTASRPFADATPATLMYKHLSEPVPDITTQLSDLPEELNVVIQRATAKDPSDRYEDAVELAREFRQAIRDATDSPAPRRSTGIVSSTSNIIIPEPKNPYKGLRAFQQADAPDFFGRDQLISSILERMTEPESIARFLAVVGPSGSGKSSVVKAGVLPRLREGAIEGSSDWFLVEMVPGIDPMEELEAALLRIAVNPPESLLQQLKEDERGLVRAIKRVLPDDNTELLLVIDQFEELFTLVEEEADRALFLNSLVEAVLDSRSRLRVIVTLRADFYDGPLGYNQFGDLMKRRTEVVLPLNNEELEAAILGPAHAAGMTLEQGVVTALITSVSEQPGMLPLLQYALTELYERRDGHTLTMDAYNEIGGTMGALARRADELYDGLGDDGQKAAQQIFLRLVTLGEGTEDTRRRALQTELISIGEDQDLMEMVIDAFGRYRLLTFDHDPQTRAATVEVAHEALIRQWQRLRDWLDQNRDNLRTQRRISTATEEWLQANKDVSFLARGTRLEQFEEWQKTSNLGMTEDEAIFLKTSIAEREIRLEQERMRQEREKALEQRSRATLRTLVVVMGVAAIIAFGLALFALSQRNDAQTASTLAEANARSAERSAAEARSLALAANSRNALNENDSVLALALALEAYEAFQPSPVEVIRVLASTAYGPGVVAYYDDYDGAVLDAVFSKDGQLTASGDSMGRVVIRDTTTNEITQTIEVPAEIVTGLAFSSDDASIVAATDDHNIYRFDIASGERVMTYEGHEDFVSSVTITQDNTKIVSGSHDHTIRIWDMQSGEELQKIEGHTGIVFEVAVSDDGSVIASSSGDETISNTNNDAVDRTVRVWNAETGREIRRFKPPDGFARTVDISGDGDKVVTATWNSTDNGVITLWDVSAGIQTQRFFGHSNIISGVEFTPDEEQIVSVSWDQTLRVWDIDTGIELNHFESFNDRLLNVNVSDDGGFAVVSAGNIGSNEVSRETESSANPGVWLIDLKSRAMLREFTGHDDWVWSTDVSPAGDMIVSGAGSLNPPARDTSVRIWDAQTGEELRRFEGHEGTVEGLDFGSDSLIASSGWDGQVILWHPEDGEIRRLIGHSDGQVKTVVFDPEQTVLASGDTNGLIILWNPESGEELRRIDAHDGAVSGLEFNADGTHLVSGGWDDLVKVWDVESGEELQTFEGHTNWINDVAFHPDSKRVLSGSWDASVRLWDIESGQELRQYLGHDGPVQGVAINQDGRLALSGAADGTMRLWDIESGQEVFRYTGHTNWVSEVVFMADGSAVSSSQDDTLRRWQTPQSAEQVVDWIDDHRFVRELTCSERERFRLEPLCK